MWVDARFMTITFLNRNNICYTKEMVVVVIFLLFSNHGNTNLQRFFETFLPLCSTHILHTVRYPHFIFMTNFHVKISKMEAHNSNNIFYLWSSFFLYFRAWKLRNNLLNCVFNSLIEFTTYTRNEVFTNLSTHFTRFRPMHSTYFNGLVELKKRTVHK